MARVKYSEDVISPRADKGVAVGSGFGQASLQATQKLLGTVGEIAAQTAQLSAAYMQKNKAADMKADEMAYESKLTEIMNTAAVAAKDTTDKQEIDSIYSTAQADLDKWVTGKSEGGSQNIRWKDQVPLIRGDANKRRVLFENAKINRKLDVSRRDTFAKSMAQVDEGIISGNLNQVSEAYQILVSNGTYTPEEAKAKVADSKRIIAENQRAAGYNQMNSFISALDYQEETGQITTSDKIQKMKELQEDVGGLHKKYQPIMESRLYSGLTKAYKKEKTDLDAGFKRLSSGMNSGIYKNEDLQFFLGAHVSDYDSLVLVAKSARESLVKFVPKKGVEGGAVQIMKAVEYATGGKDADGNVYTPSDAMKDMKESNSALAPFGMIMLGAAMMDEDSGVDAEGFHNSWMVIEDTPGWKNNPIRVGPNSLMGETVRLAGAYIVDGDEKSGWLQKIFSDSVAIQREMDLSKDEKRTKIRGLFKDRTMMVVEKVNAPQQTAEAVSISTQEEYDALPSGSRYIHPDGTTRTKK